MTGRSSRPEEAYLLAHGDFAQRASLQDPIWLGRLRDEAIGRFDELGFPSTRLEDWRYTNVSPLTKQHFRLAPRDAPEISTSEIEELASPLFACSYFVFMNGHYRPELSTPPALAGDLPVKSLGELRRREPSLLESQLGQYAEFKDRPFTALNTAFLDDGAVVRIPRNTVVDQPLHLLFLSTDTSPPSVFHPRVLVVAESGSRATLIQHHLSIGERVRFTNSVSEVLLQADAELEMVLLQRENDASFHVSGLYLRQERDSRFSCHTLSLGGALVRNELCATLAGEGAEVSLNGLFLGAGRAVVDNHTLVDHALPHCRSRERYKGILDGEARGVFRGRVIVRPDAQRTDAEQSNANLILSDAAEVDTKPQLEIYADDVKCSHDSTIGQIDSDALFYLRSRGIEEAAARDLLTQGFAAEITHALPSAALGERMQELLISRLRESRGKAAK